MSDGMYDQDLYRRLSARGMPSGAAVELAQAMHAGGGGSGSAGPKGDTGATGPKGDKGDPGEDGTGGSGGLLSARYKGAYVNGTTYALGDLVKYSSKLWEATANGTTGTPALTVGGSAPIGAAKAGAPDTGATDDAVQCLTQPWTFTEAGTYTSVAARRTSSNAQVIGFCTGQSAGPAGAAASYLCYANMPAVASGQSNLYEAPVAFNTPLVVTAGQTLWLTMVSPSAGTFAMLSNVTPTMLGVTRAGDVKYNGAAAGTIWNAYGPGTLYAQVSSQGSGGTDGTPSTWGIALDFS